MGFKLHGNKNLAQSLKRLDLSVKKELQDAVEDYGNDKAAHFRTVVNAWKEKPQFTVRSLMSKTVYKVSVVPSGPFAERFIWVDQGTGLHGPKHAAYPIRPVNAKMLRFTTGYSARTRPVGQFNVGSGKATGDVVFAKEVIHPGIESREFNKQFDKDNQSEFVRSVVKAVDNGVKSAR